MDIRLLPSEDWIANNVRPVGLEMIGSSGRMVVFESGGCYLYLSGKGAHVKRLRALGLGGIESIGTARCKLAPTWRVQDCKVYALDMTELHSIASEIRESNLVTWPL